MDHQFECIIDSFVLSNVGIDAHFLSEELAGNLANHALDIESKQLLVPAGIGNNQDLVLNRSIRTDSIYWLDRSHGNCYENEFLDLVDRFVLYLNEQCYTGINGYEFHFAVYEDQDFYLKHIDQFKSDTSRQFSMISYLNPDWVESDGGQLKIYQNGGDQVISPMNRKMVFFKSNQLAHEVLVTHKKRLSIAGWLKRN